VLRRAGRRGRLAILRLALRPSACRRCIHSHPRIQKRGRRKSALRAQSRRTT